MADSVYWIGSAFDLAIRRAPLSGGGNVDTLYSGAGQGVSMPHGLAIDSAAGRIYWTNRDDDTIRRAPIAGGGTVETLYSGTAQGVNEPAGIAVHPAGGRIYWASTGDSTIRRAPLSAGGTVETLYAAAHGVNGPTGVTIDPAAGWIYWANVGIGSGAIMRAPLVGVAGGGTVTTLYGTQDVSVPWWVAIDPAAARIYWTHWSAFADGRIRGAPIGGAGSIDTLYDYARGVSYAGGIAIDPDPTGPTLPRLEVDRAERFSFSSWLRDLISRPPAPSGGRIYWGNGVVGGGAMGPAHPSNNTIQRAPVAGNGTVDTLYGPAQGVSAPAGLALLRAPIASAPPTVGWQFTLSGGGFGGQFFGGSHSGLIQRLGCSRGTWAPDLLGSFLYRVPQSFAYQWRLNGTDIGGANSAQYNPTTPGDYSCRVTATNAAGSAVQTSAAFTVTSGMLPAP